MVFFSKRLGSKNKPELPINIHKYKKKKAHKNFTAVFSYSQRGKS